MITFDYNYKEDHLETNFTDKINHGDIINYLNNLQNNYELPKNMEFYIHRTGRTGRVDFDGITVYDTTGMNYVKATTGSTIPVSVWFSVDAPYDDMKIKVELTSNLKRKNNAEVDAIKSSLIQNVA